MSTAAPQPSLVTSRITFHAADKAQALLAARRVRHKLEAMHIGIIRGEYVLLDGRLYIDVEATTAPDAGELQNVAGGNATVEVGDCPASVDVDECVNCGNIADAPITRCPNCGLIEISRCPSCQTSVPRTGYLNDEGNLFKCPTCATRVRLEYSDPLWDHDGRYREPVIVVTLAG